MSKDLFKSLTTDGASIKAMLASISTTMAEMKQFTQIAFASCIMHAVKHGDTTLANIAQDAIDAIGDALRTNAVRAYFVANGPFYYNEESKKLRYSKQKAAVLRAEFEKGEAAFGTKIMANHWTTYKPETPFQGYSLVGKIKALIAKAEKDLKESDRADKVRDADEKTLTSLKAYLEQFDVSDTKKAA
jgi:hypothetical protein